MAAWTSWAAASMLRFRSNCIVICELPRTLVDVICASPAICANCVSSGWATDEAMISGLAPGSWALTRIVGKSTCGSGATGSSGKATTPTRKIPAISRVVATGRSMNGREMFTALLCPAVRDRALSGVGGARLAHAGLRLQAILVAGRDALALGKALLHLHQLAGLRADRQRRGRDRRVCADDVREHSVRPALQRARRDRERLPVDVGQQSHVDELTRPELALGIRERRLDADGPGRLVDLVVDQRHGAAIDLFAVVAGNGDRGHRPAVQGFADVAERVFRQAEDDRDRLQLRNDDDAAGVRCVHVVAGIDLADSGPAGDRRRNARVGELRLRIRDARGIALHLRLELRDLGALRIDRLLARKVLGSELLVPSQVPPSVRECRLVLREHGPRLVEGRLEWSRVDLREQVALLDVLAFREADRLQLAVDAGGDRDRIERLHGAEPFDVDR